ncbi:TonB-dependent receptor domain-containing protein [Peristeroidobacter agariperforans]|uniref:TonB-dependent receptor domain-containing protein n=1 Tax=Peristeroidobacter agariperforans TaxID=268404 RepID=UPI0018E5873A|nr:TonB-dependent receptor [Peristeroidobacter agariperforans]
MVTGSLLRRSQYAEKSPLQILTREDFATSAPDTFQDIAKNLTVAGGAEFQNETGNLIGMSQLNLRGLGLGSSLVLINGRRGGISTIADGGGNQFFDINQLPLAMIERIDVLTDGASATYGSQAVAGVANIITRKGFEGLEVSAKYADSVNESQIVNLAVGSKTDKGTLDLYASYQDHTRVDRTDLDWLLQRLHHTGDLSQSVLLSNTGAPGAYQRALFDPATGTYYTAPGTNTIADPNCAAAGGVPSPTRCRFDFSDQTSIIPEEKRFQVFTEGSYNASEQLELYFESSFSRNRINRTLTPSLFEQGLVSPRTVPGAVSPSNILIPASHPFNFFVQDPANPNRIVYIDPAQWDNSIHRAVDVSAIARPLGSQFKDIDREIGIDYWRGVGGVDFDLTERWNTNFSYMYASSKRTDDRAYEFVKQNVNELLLSGQWNPFGTSVSNPSLISPKDGTSVAANSDEVLRSLWRTARDEAETTQTVFDLVVRGEAFEWFGSHIGLAVGAQYREESLTSFIDALTASGQGSLQSTVTTAPVRGTDKVTSYFAESVMPFGRAVELQMALRHESFDDAGFDTTDPKIAARWQAADWLALRASFGTSFQAPSVRQKSTSLESAFIQDSARINATTGTLECVPRNISNPNVANNTVVRVVGSDDLKPQEAESYTFGLILQPAGGLDVSLDYWRFDYKDLITPDEGAQAIVTNDCADGVPDDPRITRDAGGQLRTVNSLFINAGSVLTQGVDLAASYELPWRRLGEFALGVNATWLHRFDIQLDENSPKIDGRGNRNFTNPFRSTPVWRANTSLSWHSGAHDANLTVRYIDSYRNDQGNTEVADWTTLDAQYAFTLSNLLASKTTLTIGANNLLDEDPPSLGDRIRPGYDDVVHDVRGRIAYAQIEVSF